MKSQRQLQVGEQIKRIISEIFLREGLLNMASSYITILEADASPDMKNVKIYIDIFGDEKKHEAILASINKAAPHFRHELGKRLTLRNVPEIAFLLDKTQQQAMKLEALIEAESQHSFLPKEIKITKKVVSKNSKKTTTKKTSRKK